MRRKRKEVLFGFGFGFFFFRLTLFQFSNSIYAQRTVERFFITPDARIAKTTDPYLGQPMSAAAHSDVMATPGGVRSSYDGALQYAAEARERRDELLAKYAVEKN